ncbi:MAG: TIGR00725 family protein [Candidatus Altiarchaeota archaeon]
MNCIGVIGSDGQISRELAEAAEYVGAQIAETGCVLICGGHGGVMEAACRGAKKKGGITVGILPESGKEHANKYVDIALPTGLGYARNALVGGTPDVVIAVGGVVGTLAEIGMALSYGKPVVVVEGLDGVGEKIPEEYRKKEATLRIHKAKKEDAVKKALSLINRKL